MKIVVADRDGVSHELDAVEGWRVMEIVRAHGGEIELRQTSERGAVFAIRLPRQGDVAPQ